MSIDLELSSTSHISHDPPRDESTSIFKPSLFSVSPIIPSTNVKGGVREERVLFIVMEIIIAVTFPLVFRLAFAAGECEDDDTGDWGADINGFERFLLVVIFVDTLSWLFKGLPMLSGSPTDVESSKSCTVEGRVVLGAGSPFVSEDEAIFFRSMLGRTCTVFSTCASRHNIRGLYVDTILNEKRFAGEENRRHMWFAWHFFLTALVDICERRASTTKCVIPDTSSHDNEQSKASDEPSGAKRKRHVRLASIFQAPTMYTQFLAVPSNDTGSPGSESVPIADEPRMEDISTAEAEAVVVDRNGGARRSRLTSLFSKDDYAPKVDSSQVAMGNDGVVSPMAGSAEPTKHSPPCRRSSVFGTQRQGSMRRSRLASLYASNAMEVYTVDHHPEATPEESDNWDTMSAERDESTTSGTAEERAKRISWRQSASGQFGGREKVLISDEERTRRLALLSAPRTINLETIFPVAEFLSCWLEVIKEREWTYNYLDTGEALVSLFLAAPFMDHFHEDDILAVHGHLTALFEVFVGVDMMGKHDTRKNPLPLHVEDIHEINWVLTIPGDLAFDGGSGPIYPPGDKKWDIKWSYMSRARLRPVPTDSINWQGATPLFESTRIRPGAIVVKKPHAQELCKACDTFSAWKQSRAIIYKVEKVDHTKGVDGVVLLQPFVSLTPDDISAVGFDPSRAVYHNESQEGDLSLKRCEVPMEDIKMLELNRGKAGAMNVYADYLRAVAKQWNDLDGCSTAAVQVLEGIIDARHMLAEPNIFWNEALPYLSYDKTTKTPTKKFGSGSSTRLSKFPACMLVQYPQCFTNVNHLDYLDNTNGAYYTLWQALRDGAKVATSSGSNAIWDITPEDFTFATTSRIEDTGTSHEYLHHSKTVSMPCFVAYGIAKKTEDYLEAVYRWSAGAVELFWGAVFSWKIVHFVIVGTVAALMAMACFAKSGAWYYLWLILLGLGGLKVAIDKYKGFKPLRGFIVSTVVVINVTNWIGNILSPTWTILVPLYIAVQQELPLASSSSMAMFWLYSGVLLRLSQAYMTDRIVNICRLVNPITKEWNFDRTIWRATQLYSVSFGFTFLSFCAGTASAYRAKYKAHDLTMWSSFRVSDAAMEIAWKNVRDATSVSQGCLEFCRYAIMLGKSAVAACRMPDVATRWQAVFTFAVQVVCFLWVALTADEISVVVVAFAVCALNIALVIDIANLLFPLLERVFGKPARPEYVIGFLSILLLALRFVSNETGLGLIRKSLII